MKKSIHNTPRYSDKNRVEVTLTTQVHRLVEQSAKRLGVTKAQIIRDAIHEAYSIK